mmetsp:Transcript_99604/g.277305  ORF Transcript_99604/g.277305 Transcript_99604/m.277305 type:complete len:97 (-) Transcript_99604:239-529(-)
MNRKLSQLGTSEGWMSGHFNTVTMTTFHGRQKLHHLRWRLRTARANQHLERASHRGRGAYTLEMQKVRSKRQPAAEELQKLTPENLGHGHCLECDD